LFTVLSVVSGVKPQGVGVELMLTQITPARFAIDPAVGEVNA
jgi:hypothetical protein